MKYFLIFLYCLVYSKSFGQKDEYIEGLKQQYSEVLNLNCDVEIIVDVEGIEIPKKNVHLRFINNELQIEGDGISLLPKKGIINHFNDLLKSPFQSIYLSKRRNNRVYKLVSLDENSDWITADLEFDQTNYEIVRAIVNTRKFGSFKVENSYSGFKYPSSTLITFNIKKFKLPLKFLGRMDNSVSNQGEQEITEGKVRLNYIYIN